MKIIRDTTPNREMLNINSEWLTKERQTLTKRCKQLTETLNWALNSVQGSMLVKSTLQFFGGKNAGKWSLENAFKHVLHGNMVVQLFSEWDYSYGDTGPEPQEIVWSGLSFVYKIFHDRFNNLANVEHMWDCM